MKAILRMVYVKNVRDRKKGIQMNKQYRDNTQKNFEPVVSKQWQKYMYAC